MKFEIRRKGPVDDRFPEPVALVHAYQYVSVIEILVDPVSVPPDIALMIVDTAVKIGPARLHPVGRPWLAW